MNNLHRELAPISAAAWADLEAEARRTFALHLAGRRVVDVLEPAGGTLAAVGTGHQAELDPPDSGVQARRQEAASVVEFRVPFQVSRTAVDDVERGAKDADWQPVKDAAKQLAFVEDRTVIDGYPAGGIAGLRAASSNASVSLPEDPRELPTALAQAISALRLTGVAGPYSLLLSAELYTLAAETSDHGYLIRDQLSRVLGAEGEIVWAPAIDGAVVLSTRGGDYALHLGQDVSIGYSSHDADSVSLYFQESLTFLVQTAEAAVGLT